MNVIFEVCLIGSMTSVGSKHAFNHCQSFGDVVGLYVLTTSKHIMSIIC